MAVRYRTAATLRKTKMNIPYNELAQLVYDIDSGTKTLEQVVTWINTNDYELYELNEPEVIEDDLGLSPEELAEDAAFIEYLLTLPSSPAGECEDFG